ncbi:MAG TPA: 23S rRNA (guanosine(2251)-2'-O)-methyltransferase RlmB [Acidimicrobiia bacterium]
MASAGIGDRVEGIHAVQAAVEAGRVTDVYVLPSMAEREQGLLEVLRGQGGRVFVRDDLRGVAVTDSHQGIVALARPLQTFALSDLVEQSDRPALVVLDHLEDPHNIGAVARTALAAGLDGLVVPSRRAAPLGAAAFKAAAGAFERLPVSVVSSIADAVLKLRELGLWTVGLAAGGESSLFGLALLSEPVALVVGSEGTGLGRLIARRVDVIAGIPMAAGCESLNASVAAALGMYEIMRTRSRPG